MIRLTPPKNPIDAILDLGGSKSESNRWLILKKIYPELGEIKNLSDAQDTIVLQQALDSTITTNQTIDIGHAGTAMRFLTAYYATTPESHIILTGSERMQQRPIAPLVEALNALGCDIKYVNNIGYPPLEISGKQINKSQVTIRADISSQYITALMLIAPKLPAGLTINFEGALTSRSYVEMTQAQLESLDIQVEWLENGIRIYPKHKLAQADVIVESDWSSASYWYSIIALSAKGKIQLGSYTKDSLQGDARLAEIYEQYFGVRTIFENNKIFLSKTPNFKYPTKISLDLNDTPDLAQTIAVTCAGLKIQAELTGLRTLKIKETDRLQALQNELSKFNTSTIISSDAIDLISFGHVEKTIVISTYDDHRMAMAFAPLTINYPLIIEDPEVVKKSYPNFWKDLATIGITVENL